MEAADERRRQRGRLGRRRSGGRRRGPPPRRARARARTVAGAQDPGGGDPEGGARARAGKKADLAVALAAGGRFAVKTVATVLGVARSNLIERRDQKRPRRGPQTRAGDVELAAEIRRLVDQRPTYGYRDRKSTRLNSSHSSISYAVFCLKKKKKKKPQQA